MFTATETEREARNSSNSASRGQEASRPPAAIETNQLLLAVMAASMGVIAIAAIIGVVVFALTRPPHINAESQSGKDKEVAQPLTPKGTIVATPDASAKSEKKSVDKKVAETKPPPIAQNPPPLLLPDDGVGSADEKRKHSPPHPGAWKFAPTKISEP